MQNIPTSDAQNSAYPFTPPAGGSQLKIQTTAKPVTPFAGLLPFLAWLGNLGLPAKLEELMPFILRSPNAINPAHTLLAFLLTVVLGGARFAHSDWLRFDHALHAMAGIPRFPGKDAVRRFFHRFTQGDIERFWRPLWAWLLAFWTPPAGGFSLDLDSSVFQRSGAQEGAAKGYNPSRPGRLSHHPLLAALAEAPLILHTWSRSGNTASGRGVVAFLIEALGLLPKNWTVRCVRADSGFFEQGLLAFLEERGLSYIITAKMTRNVKSKLTNIPEADWRSLDKKFSVASFCTALMGWKRKRRFVVVRERTNREKGRGKAKGRKLMDVPGYTYRVFVTNTAAEPENIWRDYNQRASMEQRIEELKNDLHMDGFCAQRFFATEAAMLAVGFAFNLLSTFQSQVTPAEGYHRPSTLRSAVFLCGAVLGREGRQQVLRVSSAGGGAEKQKPLINKALATPGAKATLLGPEDRPNYADQWGRLGVYEI
jgi:DNA-directed RNA polymerase subunit N (RpoN/RPB10)